jgi:hypothetical protein
MSEPHRIDPALRLLILGVAQGTLEYAWELYRQGDSVATIYEGRQRIAEQHVEHVMECADEDAESEVHAVREAADETPSRGRPVGWGST